jgi:hypothetical protein
MSDNTTYTKNSWIFQEFLLLLGHLSYQTDRLLKAENQILRSKLGPRECMLHHLKSEGLLNMAYLWVEASEIFFLL